MNQKPNHKKNNIKFYLIEKIDFGKGNFRHKV